MNAVRSPVGKGQTQNFAGLSAGIMEQRFSELEQSPFGLAQKHHVGALTKVFFHMVGGVGPEDQQPAQHGTSYGDRGPDRPGILT